MIPLILVTCGPFLVAGLRAAPGLNVSGTQGRSSIESTVEEHRGPGTGVSVELLRLIRKAAAAKAVRGGRYSLQGQSGNVSLVSNRSTSLLKSRHSKFGGRIVEQLEDWKDHNLAVKSAAPPEHSNQFLEVMSATEYENLIRAFVGSASSRFVYDPGNQKAQTFIINHMKQSGLSVTVEDVPLQFNSYAADAHNIIGELRGSSKPDEFVILGAHYDSIPEQGFAPGADDNGSGIASLLLSARAFKESGFKPKRSIRFVAFTAEEIGLVGSAEYVRQLSGTERENFRGAIILDQVGYRKDRNGETSVIFETHGREDGKQKLIDTMAHATRSIPAWGGAVKFQCNYAGWGSDHMPFLDNGLPAVLLIERDNLYYADRFGHTAQDTLDNLDYEFGASVAAIAAASIGNLADPPS